VGPKLAEVDGRVAIELIVGLPDAVPLLDGGRDMDNFLFPIAQRLGPEWIAAMFGRKVHGPSWSSAGPARPEASVAVPHFSARLTRSYERRGWKQKLHDRLLREHVAVSSPVLSPWTLR
jgi:hypothetical protein